MSNDTFLEASKAAESWLSTVSLVSHIGKLGKPGGHEPAYFRLCGTDSKGTSLQDSYARHAGILGAEFNKLATLSDGPVNWESHGRLYAWSSAHEAACGISELCLDLLVAPLCESGPLEMPREAITDTAEQQAMADKLLAERWEAISIAPNELASLQERIRRERAKMNDKKSTSKTQEPDSSAMVPENLKTIVEDKDLSAEQKLSQLTNHIPGLYAWKSPKLATSLGVTDGAIRQTHWWQVDRVEWLEKQKEDYEPPGYDDL